jgi:putative SOS response-associated peptidase YedK
MCYTVKSEVTVAAIKKKYGDAAMQLPEELPAYEKVSGFEHPLLPVITSEEPTAVQLMHWGLVPHWVKEEQQAAQLQNSTLNAKAETIFEKPSFRSIINKRCLILVNGFYEWQQQLKEKIPYFIKLKSDELFALGGLYDEWVNTNTGELYKSFSIVTVAANPLMETIHNTKKRMPLILPVQNESKWIESGVGENVIKSLLLQYPEADMEAQALVEKSNTPSLWD